MVKGLVLPAEDARAITDNCITNRYGELDTDEEKTLNIINEEIKYEAFRKRQQITLDKKSCHPDFWYALNKKPGILDILKEKGYFIQHHTKKNASNQIYYEDYIIYW